MSKCAGTAFAFFYLLLLSLGFYYSYNIILSYSVIPYKLPFCSDFCKVPVFDYHRHCPRCLYDLCLDCCRDIRRSQTNVVIGEYAESKGPVVETNKDSASNRARLEPSAASVNDKLFPQPIDANDIGIRSISGNSIHKFPRAHVTNKLFLPFTDCI